MKETVTACHLSAVIKITFINIVDKILKNITLKIKTCVTRVTQEEAEVSPSSGLVMFPKFFHCT